MPNLKLIKTILMTKFFFDVTVGAIALIIFAPLLIIISIAIRLSMGPGVIFSQPRPGRYGKVFNIYKFRTMIPNDFELNLSDEARITSLGKWLRSTSLDELPELLNVVKGEMSLVGPRPLLVDYLTKYSEFQMRRHNVLPGITGLAQVRGRNNLSWRHKLKYDIFYVNHANLLFDIQILVETIFVVISKKGFRSHGEDKRFDA